MKPLFFSLCLTGILLGCGHTPAPETPAQPSPGGGVIIDMFPPPKTGDWGTEKGSQRYRPRDLEWVTTKLQAYAGGTRSATNYSYTVSIHEGHHLRGEVRVRITCHSHPDDKDGRYGMLNRIIFDLMDLVSLINDEVQARRITPWSPCAILELTYEARGKLFPELKETIVDWNEPYEHMKDECK